MLMPSIFKDNFLDDFMESPFQVRASRNNVMSTDVKETATAYEVTMDIPGFKKEDVKGELKDGYLTISAVTSSANDEKNEDGKYIRRERFSGSYSRSFYVGEEITQEDIKAKFEDGTLKFSIPKKEARPQAETRKFISIE